MNKYTRAHSADNPVMYSNYQGAEFWGLYYKSLQRTENEIIYGKAEKLQINCLNKHFSLN